MGSLVFSLGCCGVFFLYPLFFVSLLSVPESPSKASGFLLCLMLFCNFLFPLWHELLGSWKSIWGKDYRPGHCLVHTWSDGQGGKEEVAAYCFSPCISTTIHSNTNHNTCLVAGSKLAQSHLTVMWSSKRCTCSESSNPTVFCALWSSSPTPMALFLRQGYVFPSQNSSFSVLCVFTVAFHSQNTNWNNFALIHCQDWSACKCLEHSWWYFWPGVLIGAHRCATSFSSSLMSLRKVKANDRKWSSNTDGR